MERLMPRALQPYQTPKVPQPYTSLLTRDSSKSTADSVDSKLDLVRRAADQYEIPVLGQLQASHSIYSYGELNESRRFPDTGNFGKFVTAPGTQEVANGLPYPPPPSLSHCSDTDTLTSSPETSRSEPADLGPSLEENESWASGTSQESMRYGIWDGYISQHNAAAHMPGYFPLQPDCEMIGLDVFEGQCFGQLPISCCGPQQSYLQMPGALQAQNIFSQSSVYQPSLPLQRTNNIGQRSLADASLCSRMPDARDSVQGRDWNGEPGQTIDAHPKDAKQPGVASQVGRLMPGTGRSPPHISHGSSQRRHDDEILLRGKKAGMTYKEIKRMLGSPAAESTLRGRFRSLTKARKDRVRKPIWTEHDIKLLKTIVAEELDRLDAGNCRALTRGQKLSKVSWKKVAEYIAKRGGSYHFGNSTCKKKWSDLH